MKKNGFTLIEIIAVIVVLGVILLIIMPNFTDILNRSRQRLNQSQKDQIISSARVWGIENLGSSNDVNKITIATLQNGGYLEDKEIKDLIDRKEIKTDTVICITFKDNQYIYTYEGETIEGDKKCTK